MNSLYDNIITVLNIRYNNKINRITTLLTKYIKLMCNLRPVHQNGRKMKLIDPKYSKERQNGMLKIECDMDSRLQKINKNDSDDVNIERKIKNKNQKLDKFTFFVLNSYWKSLQYSIVD